MPKPNFAKAIGIAGLTCGVMDISAALIVYGAVGAKPLRLLQGIAGGVLGPRTYNGGVRTALLGLLLHFVIAFGAATIFFLGSRFIRFLVDHSVLSGVLYGIAVLFHESGRSPAVRCHKIPLLGKGHAYGRGHSHLLRRHSHFLEHPQIRPISRCSLPSRRNAVSKTLDLAEANWLSLKPLVALKISRKKDRNLVDFDAPRSTNQ